MRLMVIWRSEESCGWSVYIEDYGKSKKSCVTGVPYTMNSPKNILLPFILRTFSCKYQKILTQFHVNPHTEQSQKGQYARQKNMMSFREIKKPWIMSFFLHTLYNNLLSFLTIYPHFSYTFYCRLFFKIWLFDISFLRHLCLLNWKIIQQTLNVFPEIIKIKFCLSHLIPI